MQEKFLRDAIGYIVGKQNEPLVDILQKDKYINEFLIAKKLNIEINQTRNILYRLTEHGIVSSTRKKDAKKGWYTYFWKIEITKSFEFLKNLLIKRIHDMNSQIKSRETKLFYICETCNVEHNEENALLNNFICNECGNVYVLKDNTKVIRDMKKELDSHERELEYLNLELGKEKAKDDHKKDLVMKKVAKEKLEERQAKYAKRKLEKQKLAGTLKKDSKKPSKKSSAKKPVKKSSQKKSSKKQSKAKTKKK
ncbi:hypothetical protein COU57_02220 [Candidatus Pacearchaeota archaeon CG10_big_fil_rev_8_21_14_0_10_32_14]|nr:MAG: hypothetical protein COU57_02220 [Candidatus Pacearchaeota archaeon CG10_big_fil_rev_8_21_14_0_10_32_14]